MSNVEHYFENLLFNGKDCKGEPNKNSLSKEVQEAVEECAQYIKYSGLLKENYKERKSEWEHDHEILKAYSDGASDILDKIKNEFIDRYPRNYANELELGGRSCVFSLNEILRIINKYTEESKEVAEDGKIN